MKKMWLLILLIALSLNVSVAEAKKFGGSFGGGMAKVRPMPSSRPSSPSIPRYTSPSVPKVTSPSVPSTPKIFSGNKTNNGWTIPKPRPRQRRPDSYTPTYNNFSSGPVDSGPSSNFWFWMYMMNSGSSTPSQAAPVVPPVVGPNVPPAPLSYAPTNAPEVTTSTPPQYSQNKSSTDWGFYMLIGIAFFVFCFIVFLIF